MDLKMMKVILNSTLMMKLMNSSLLDAQQIKDKCLRLNWTTFNPMKTVKDMIEMFDSFIQAKGILVRVFSDHAGGVGDIICDEERVKEILYHILANAIKFNQEQGGMIIVKVGLD